MVFGGKTTAYGVGDAATALAAGRSGATTPADAPPACLARRRKRRRATPASLVVAALVEKLGRPCGVDAVPAGTLCAVICGGGCSLVAAVGEVVPMGSSGVLGRRRSVSRGQCGILAIVVSADWLGV